MSKECICELEVNAMALMKCPDCGKIVSSHAVVCPNCGCPSDFFQPINDAEQNNNININNAPTKTFIIGDYSISFPFASDSYRGFFGAFTHIAYDAMRAFDSYYQDHSIEEILKELPQDASNGLTATINEVMKILYKEGEELTENEFYEKYRYKYEIDYAQKYETVVELYVSICNEEQRLKNIRNVRKASRGRWIGGGFGLEGAVKGAITSGLLNAGQDFIHLISNSNREYRDNKKIQDALKDLKNSALAHKSLIAGLGECIMGCFYALVDELHEIGSDFMGTYPLDRTKAEKLYENTIKYDNDREHFVSNILKCITLYPGEKKYYEAIKPELLKDGKDQLYDLLKYWYVDYLYCDS